MEPNTHTHDDDDDDDVLYMSTHIHTGAMTCSSFSGNFLLSNELYNHSIGGHIYSISYSLLMAVCVCVYLLLFGECDTKCLLVLTVVISPSVATSSGFPLFSFLYLPCLLRDSSPDEK
jgi:hypothetical protein